MFPPEQIFQNNCEIFGPTQKKIVPPSMCASVPLYQAGKCVKLVSIVSRCLMPVSRVDVVSVAVQQCKGYNSAVGTWFSSVKIIETWIIRYSLRLRRKTLQHNLESSFYHSVSDTLQSPSYTLEYALRWRAGCTDEQPGLTVLCICGSNQFYVAHRKNEASTVHLSAACLFLWFV